MTPHDPTRLHPRATHCSPRPCPSKAARRGGNPCAHPDKRAGPRVWAIALTILTVVLAWPERTLADASGAIDVVIAAVPRHFPPYYTTDKKGYPSGFAIDAMNHIAARAGLRVTYRVERNWAAVFEAVRTGRAQVIPNLGISADREGFVRFTAPLETVSTSIFVRHGSADIQRLPDLTGKSVAAIEVDVAVLVLNALPGVRTVLYRDPRAALFDLLAGRLDAFAYPRPVVEQMARDIGVEQRILALGEPLIEVKRAVAVRRQEAALFERLDNAVTTIVSTPEYQAIYVKWFGTPRPFWTVPRVAWAMGVLFAVALAALLAWRYRSLVELNRHLAAHMTERKRTEEILRAQTRELAEKSDRLEALAAENARLYEQQRQVALDSQATVAERTTELRHALRGAESASRIKSEFLATMSHELKTPLNAIIGFSELLQAQHFGALNEKQGRYVQNILMGGKYLLQLINDLLDLSKLEAGRLEVELEPVHLPYALKSAVERIYPEAEAKGLQLTLRMPEDLPPITADPARLGQIIYNLLSNAVKFTPPGGSVTLTARPVQGSAFRVQSRPDAGPEPSTMNQERHGEFVEIAIRDTGIGIKAEDLPKLFQPFTQLDAYLSRRHQGTGLGLALTKRLVEMHGGQIRAESPGEGHGSTFIVLLPANGALPAEDPEAPIRPGIEPRDRAPARHQGGESG